jgi:hypothetical protein
MTELQTTQRTEYIEHEVNWREHDARMSSDQDSIKGFKVTPTRKNKSWSTFEMIKGFCFLIYVTCLQH